MSAPLILPGQVGDALRPRLTVDGIRNLLMDLRRAGRELPYAILVSERDRRDINQDLMAGSKDPVAREDQRPEHDGVAIGVIEGVVIRGHPEIPNGKARLVFQNPLLKTPPPPAKLGGEGLIIVGA